MGNMLDCRMAYVGPQGTALRKPRRIGALGVALALTLGVVVPARAHDLTERVSVGPGGVQGNDRSFVPSISADGRFVAFPSAASNLVPGDTNGQTDVFVRDRQMDTTRRVNVGPGGVQGDNSSFFPSISATGRFVAFVSHASNLVSPGTNGWNHVFVRDRQRGTTRLVSVGPQGVQGNADCYLVTISANGRFVAFYSDASNLVPRDTNRAADVFLRDRQTGTTRRVSVGPHGVQGNGSSGAPSISADGRFVAFDSAASNLVRGDTNGQADVFVRDRQMATTRRVSVGPGGVQGNSGSGTPSISADGRFVAFDSAASNLVPGDTNGQTDVFLHDRQTGTTLRMSIGPGGIQGNDHSYQPSISADGRFVAFSSFASNLVPGGIEGQEDVYVRDRRTGTTRRVSLARGGAPANGDSFNSSISADGRFVAFESFASNLVPGDTNDALDVFVRTLVP
jgi:Tol biopolymer transport system component